MIYGNPLDFAVWIDEVPSWTYEVLIDNLKPFTSIEGLILIIIDGKFFTPDIGAVCTLQSHLHDLKRALKGIESGVTEVANDIGKDELYRNGYFSRYVGDFVGRTGMGVEIECDLINRTHWTFYLFSSGEQERLVYSQNYGDTVFEKILMHGTVMDVLKSLPTSPEFLRKPV